MRQLTTQNVLKKKKEKLYSFGLEEPYITAVLKNVSHNNQDHRWVHDSAAEFVLHLYPEWINILIRTGLGNYLKDNKQPAHLSLEPAAVLNHVYHSNLRYR